MEIIFSIISILGITALFWRTSRSFGKKICPICAGVSGTWIWMLAAKFLGYKIDLIIPAMLMAGSVVGISYQLEKRFQKKVNPLLWKTLFISTGFAATYFFIYTRWIETAIAITLLIFLTFIAKKESLSGAATKNSKATKELEEKMKNCC